MEWDLDKQRLEFQDLTIGKPFMWGENGITSAITQILVSRGTVGKPTSDRKTDLMDNFSKRIKVLRPNEVSKEQKTGLDRASSFGELYAEIIRKGGITGSKEHFTPEALIKIIEEVRNGKSSMESITRSDGLRFKVMEFLEDK